LIAVGKYRGEATGIIKVKGSAAGTVFNASFDLSILSTPIAIAQ